MPSTEVEEFYARYPEMVAFVEATGDAHADEVLEMSPVFWDRLCEAFPAPGYDPMTGEQMTDGTLGILQGFVYQVVEDLPVAWRFRGLGHE